MNATMRSAYSQSLALYEDERLQLSEADKLYKRSMFVDL